MYAPALVAFFGAPGVTVSVGTPFVSWVALGWGEPVVPWWGRPGYIGRPHWAGWGGPRVVNNVVVNKTTVVNVTNINVYRNTTVNNAVVAVRRDGFGRGSVRDARVEQVDVKQLRPVHGRLDIKPEAASFVASGGAAPARPPQTALERPVVATRPPARHSGENLPPRTSPVSASGPVNVPAPKIVPAPKNVEKAAVPARPPLGASDVERQRRSEPQRLEAAPRPQGAGAPAAEPRAIPEPRDERRARESQPAAQGAGAPRQETPPGVREGPARGGQERGRGPERAAPPSATPPAAGAPSQVVSPSVRQPQAATPPVVHQPAPQQPTPPGRQQPQESGQQGGRPLPGEPANRVFPGRSEGPHAAPAVGHQATTPPPQRGGYSPGQPATPPPAHQGAAPSRKPETHDADQERKGPQR